MAINSFAQSKFGKGVDWKDRVYSANEDKDFDPIEDKVNDF